MKNKKDYIYDVIRENNLDICLLQEVEITEKYGTNLPTHREFRIKVKTNCVKARTIIIIKGSVLYERQKTLEQEDSGTVIIDLNGPQKYSIINIYTK